MIRTVLFVVVSVMVPTLVFSAAEIVVNNVSFEENKFSVFVLPEEELNISVGKIDGDFIKRGAAVCNWSIPKDSVVEENDNLDIKLISPKSNDIYQIKLKINYKDKEYLKTILMFVLVPIEDNKKLDNYFLSLVNKIDKVNAGSLSGVFNAYSRIVPKTVMGNFDNYEKVPKGIIEVTKDNENTFISEHFRLNDFLCKGDRVYPKYLCLDYNLVRKLEVLIDELNTRGHKINKITIMSGFRTPWYNKKVNVTKFSRHIYGDAADIYIDMNKNNIMDDLNKDGRVNIKDARYLFNIIDEMDKKGIYPGGLSCYPSNRHHGPFVHVDARGYIVRW